MFQLVRFSCDCVGTMPVNGISTIVRSCDGEGANTFYQRTIEKNFQPLSAEQTEVFRSEIEKLIFDGYGLRSIKNSLGLQRLLE
jgi:hypothetical protein